MSTSTKHAASLAVLCAATVTAGLAVGVAGTAVALADEPPPSVKLSVPHNMDAVHAAQLYRQIQTAAREVCAPLDSKELDMKRQYNICVAHAVSNAVAQVRSKQLSAIHLAATSATGNPQL